MELSRAKRSLIQRLHRSKTRAREERVLVEGIRAVRDTVSAGVVPEFAVVAPRASELGGDPVVQGIRAAGIEVFEVSDAEFAELADTETPQGLLIILPEPVDAPLPPASARLLVLDGVQDPGNVGTLVRTAAGLGLDGVVALDGTADPWGSRAVRAAAASGFRIPLLRRRADAFLEEWPGRLLVADAGGMDANLVSRDGERGWALVLGSEGQGPRPRVLSAADAVLSIPLARGVESLNVGVAGAILMARLTPSRSPDDSTP